MSILVLAAALSLALPGLAGNARADEPAPPARVVWQGEVEVNGSVVFSADQTLVILPGTTVRIRMVEPSCTEGTAPVITVGGDLVADGNESARIRFVSVTADGSVCTFGREAVLVYSGGAARNQSLSCSDFTGGTLLCYRTDMPIRNCTFNQTQVRFSGANSSVENCTFIDAPLTVLPSSAMLIANNTFTRGAQEESGIYLYDSAEVLDNTISNCVSGIETSIWINGTVRGNTITGCLEAINSTGALDISENTLTGNGVGLRSWAGLDRPAGNIIGDNDVGIASLGHVAGASNNTYRTADGRPNRQADIREMVLATGGCVDGNGQALDAPVTIADSAGRTVFSGDPEFVALTAYEKLPDGTERRYTPFSARASLAGASNSTMLDGSYNISFALRLELYPDIRVENFRGSFSGAAPGDQVLLTITLRNTGPVAARNFRVAAFADGHQAYLQYVNILGPGEGRNLTFRWTASAGAHSFRAVADPAGAVTELSEKDNSRSFSAEVSSPISARAVPMTVPVVLLVIAGLALILLAGPKD
jgi:hypothetical protein